MPYTSLDFLNIEKELPDESKQIQAAIRKLVDERVMPVIANCYEEDRFPADLIPVLAEQGIFGCFLEGYECLGLNYLDYGLIMMELERGDSGLRSFASVQSSLCMLPIYQFGSEEQKKKWLPGMARGELIGCFGLTEPDFGSDPSGMLTTAVRSGSKIILNGTKRWITNGGVSHLAIVWAKYEGKIRGFIVPRDRPGFIVKEIAHKLSLKASVTSELIFQNCELTEEDLLPKSEDLKSALFCLTSARYGIAWGVLGAAMACYQEALDYVKNRIVFGKPLAQKQLIQDKLVWILNEITKGQLLALRCAELKSKNELKPHHVSLAKMNNVKIALETARICRDMLGASGISTEYQVMRHMCNLESVYTYEGAHDVHKLILGEKITGLAAF